MRKDLKSLSVVVLALVLLLGIWGDRSTAASKDTVKVALWTQNKNLDPWNNAMLVSNVVTVQIFDYLFTSDPETLEVGPELATGFKVIDDTTWELTLRKGVKFTNGEPFNAEVVKYCFERVLNTERKLYDQPTWKPVIKGIEVVDDFTVRLLTHKPYPVLISKLAQESAMIPPKYVEEKGDGHFGEHPVGTGPYKLVKWSRGEEIILEVNDDYWGPKPSIKKIHYRIIPEPAVATAELITGGIDVVGRLDVDQVATIQKAKRCAIFKSPSSRIHFVQMDGDGRGGSTPLQKLEVRRAIYHAINREEIVKEVKKGFGRVAYGPIPFMMFGHDPAIKAEEPKHDPEKAKALLAKAGYSSGFEAELSGYMEKTVLEAIQGYLLNIGIKTKLNWYGADLGTLINLRNSGKVKDMAMYTWGTSMLDAEGFLPYWLAKGAAKNYNADAMVEQWLEEEAQTFDQEKRKELFKKIQQRIVEQAYWVPIFVEESLYGINKDLNLVSLLEVPMFYKSSWK